MENAQECHQYTQNFAPWIVLGAAGFIGRAVITHLRTKGQKAIGVDCKGLGSIKTGQDSWFTINIHEPSQLHELIRKMKPSVLLNAIGHDSALAAPSLCDAYVCSTAKILQAIQLEQPTCRVILIGSAAEYGNILGTDGACESAPLMPLSDYGRAKCAQFEVALRFAAEGMSVITARLFNPIGAGQSSSQFVGHLLEQVRLGQYPIHIHSGNYVRDWVDLRDVAQALFILGRAASPPSVVNICSGKGHTRGFVADYLGQLSGAEMMIEPEEISPGVLWRSLGNPYRISQLGWKPQYQLTQSISDLWR